MEQFKIQIAKAFNDYIQTEGCECCQDKKGHAEAEKKLAELLGIPLYENGNGYDWDKFITDNGTT